MQVFGSSALASMSFVYGCLFLGIVQKKRSYQKMTGGDVQSLLRILTAKKKKFSWTLHGPLGGLVDHLGRAQCRAGANLKREVEERKVQQAYRMLKSTSCSGPNRHGHPVIKYHGNTV